MTYSHTFSSWPGALWEKPEISHFEAQAGSWARSSHTTSWKKYLERQKDPDVLSWRLIWIQANIQEMRMNSCVKATQDKLLSLLLA